MSHKSFGSKLNRLSSLSSSNDPLSWMQQYSIHISVSYYDLRSGRNIYTDVEHFGDDVKVILSRKVKYQLNMKITSSFFPEILTTV